MLTNIGLAARKCNEEGEFIPEDEQPPPRDTTHDWTPFGDEPSFQFAELMFEKIQSSRGDIDELLRILAKKSAEDGAGGPIYRNCADMEETIDAIEYGESNWTSFKVKYSEEITPESPAWKREEFVVHTRDSCSIVWSIVGSVDFDGHFDYVPFEEFTGPDCQRWSNFMSGRWAFQKADTIAEDPNTHGAMLVPIILGADKTTVSVGTGNQEFHPVYLSVGNVHNEMRRAHRNALVPLAFLSIPKEFDNDEEFRIFKKQVYHTSLAQILSPLRPGMTIPEVMPCPDGHFRRAIFELGPFIADYPEQVYLAGIVQGWCPKCRAAPDELETEGMPRFRNHTELLVETFDSIDLWDAFGIVADVIPFTNHFPRADIHELITPDILHQLIKGTFKDHLVSWVEEYILMTADSEREANRILADIDRRIAAVPPFPGLCRFPEGRRFKQWTGNDSKALMKVFLPAIVGYVPDNMVRCIAAFLDFCYLVRRPSHDTPCLALMAEALDRFHHYRVVFEEEGIRPNGFSLPQQHAMVHYIKNIRLFRSPNGLCSSITESKHIPVVKRPWRASNRNNPISQMIRRNTRNSKLAAIRVEFGRRRMLSGNMEGEAAALQEEGGEDEQNNAERDAMDAEGPRRVSFVRLPKRASESRPCTVPKVSFFLITPSRLHSPTPFTLYHDDELAAADLPLDECPEIRGRISVYHCASATFYAPSERSGPNGMHREIIRANPTWRKKHPRYDTILIKMDPNFDDMRGMLVGRVLRFLSFVHEKVRYPCALIEWFLKEGEESDSLTGMWVVKPEVISGHRTVGIVHLDSVVRACHLIGVSGQMIIHFYRCLTLVAKRKLVFGCIITVASIGSAIIGFVEQHEGIGIRAGVFALVVAFATGWLIKYDLRKREHDAAKDPPWMSLCSTINIESLAEEGECRVALSTWYSDKSRNSESSQGSNSSSRDMKIGGHDPYAPFGSTIPPIVEEYGDDAESGSYDGDRNSGVLMDEGDIEPPNGLRRRTGAPFDLNDDTYSKQNNPYVAHAAWGDSITRINEVDDNGNLLSIESAAPFSQGDIYHPPDGPIKVDTVLRGTRKPPKAWRKDFVKKTKLIGLVARFGGKKLATTLTNVPYCHFGNTEKLHHCIRYTPKQPPVAYDMRLDFEGTVCFVHLNRHIEFEDLAQYTTEPPVYQMRLYHPLLPWYIDIRPNSGPGCVLGNLFASIYAKLRKEIGKLDFYNNGLDDEEREEIIDAWFLRCGLEGGEAKKYGVRRVDFLKDQVIFEGLVYGTYFHASARGQAQSAPPIAPPIPPPPLSKPPQSSRPTQALDPDLSSNFRDQSRKRSDSDSRKGEGKSFGKSSIAWFWAQPPPLRPCKGGYVKKTKFVTYTVGLVEGTSAVTNETYLRPSPNWALQLDDAGLIKSITIAHECGSLSIAKEVEMAPSPEEDITRRTLEELEGESYRETVSGSESSAEGEADSSDNSDSPRHPKSEPPPQPTFDPNSDELTSGGISAIYYDEAVEKPAQLARILLNMEAPAKDQPWWPSKASEKYIDLINNADSLLKFLELCRKSPTEFSPSQVLSVITAYLTVPLRDLHEVLEAGELISLGPAGILKVSGVVDSALQFLGELVKSRKRSLDTEMSVVIEGLSESLGMIVDDVCVLRIIVPCRLFDPPPFRDLENFLRDKDGTFALTVATEQQWHISLSSKLCEQDPTEKYLEAVINDFGYCATKKMVKSELLLGGNFGLDKFLEEVVHIFLDTHNEMHESYHPKFDILASFCTMVLQRLTNDLKSSKSKPSKRPRSESSQDGRNTRSTMSATQGEREKKEKRQRTLSPEIIFVDNSEEGFEGDERSETSEEVEIDELRKGMDSIKNHMDGVGGKGLFELEEDAKTDESIPPPSNPPQRPATPPRPKPRPAYGTSRLQRERLDVADELAGKRTWDEAVLSLLAKIPHPVPSL
ncbi:hypothetical protein JAAARDRAFT_195354 [Jaapia argillacea MUCL 33604]|uniref:DUF6699 domain-containing protein n=1 Tax=Jaapia argillacea MUCL 33604 TaxID=933084 RepID=A0A067Q0L5_9AGAM|nr:hypothetical protein JAAARDRAFT_195354 [Jaapia argillacea MUCL 33604]